MMKHLLICTALVLSFQQAISQDLIVTNEGDSIECRILNFHSEGLIFTFLEGGVEKKGFLRMEEIATFRENYFSQQRGNEQKMVSSGWREDQLRKVKLGLSYGFGYRLAEVPQGLPPDYEEQIRKTKTGTNLTLEFNYFITETMGVGLKFNRFVTRDATDVLLELNPGQFQKVLWKEEIGINYIHGNWLNRIISTNQKFAFQYDLGIGIMLYSNYLSIDGSGITITGNSLGISGAAMGDYFFQPNWSFGLNVGISFATLTELEVAGQTFQLQPEEYEGIGWLDVSIGIKGYF